MSAAQQGAEESPAALKQSQGTAVEVLAPESEASKPSAQQEPPSAQPPPAAPVQGERPAEKPCGPRCQAAEQREKAGLEAQQSMAKSAYDLVVISWWQFAAGTVGIGLLLFTLRYTRKSTKAAIEAVEAAQKTVDVSVAIELPILQVADVRIGEEGSPAQLLRDPLLRVWVENYGKTPAFIDHCVINAEICPMLPEKPNYQPHFWLTGPRPLSPGKKTQFREATYRNEGIFPYSYDDVEAGKDFLWVYGFLDYSDFLGQFHRRGFCARWDSWNERFHPDRNPNYDYLEDRAGPEEKPDFAQALADARK